MIGALLGVGEEKRKIVGDGFVDPLVPVSVPAHDVAPPLMGDFVEGHQLGEMFLSGFGKSGALLGFCGQIGIGGEIEQPGPALAECAGDLRHAQLLEWEGSAEGFVKADGVIDLAPECLQGIGRVRSRRRNLHRVDAAMFFHVQGREHGWRFQLRTLQTVVEGLLQPPIGVHIDRVRFGRERS